MTPKAPPTEEVYGIAKRMNLDLEKHPLHTHAAIINMLRTMVDHRNVELQNQVQMEQIEANEAAMADARRAHAQAQVEREAKAPRMIIELDPTRKHMPATVANTQPGVITEHPNPLIEAGAQKMRDMGLDPGQYVPDAGVSVEEALKIVSEPTAEPTQPEAVLTQ